MKKCALILTLLLVILLAFCTCAEAETSYTSGYYTYVINEDGSSCTITAYSYSSVSSLTVPSTLGGYTVTAVGDDVFKNKSYLETVSFSGSTVTSIGEDAFYGCSKLTSVTLPSSLKSIGSYAFYNCSAMSKITMPSNLESIGSYAFYNCDALTSLTLPAKLSELGSYAFNSCGGLTSVDLPAALETIPNGAFYYCSALESVTFPAALTAIGDSAFSNCTVLANPVLPEGLTSIGEKAFYYCKGLTELTLPDAVHTIGASAFANCTSLTSLTLPASLESFDPSCISGCSALTNLSISENNENLYFEDGVLFSTDGSLLYYPSDRTDASYAVPEGTTALGTNIFKNNTTLTSVTLPSTLTAIGEYAFYGCTKLTEINLPAGLTVIGNYAFYNCKLLTEIIMPDSVTYLGNYAFYNCTGLNTMQLSASLATIGDYALQNCAGITEVDLSEELAHIGKYAFAGCTGITEIYIPDSVTYTGDYAFSGCTGLASVRLSETEPALGQYIFQNCTSLKEITIPDSVESISGGLFSGCSKLESVHLPANLSSLAYSTAFSGCTSLKTLTIDEANASYRTVNNVLFSTGGTLLLYPKGITATSYIAPAGTTAISGSAFFGNGSLVSIVLPEGLTSIGDYSFSSCSKLASISLPDSLNSLGDYAFYGCSSLKSISLPDGITEIGRSVFQSCISLQSVDLPAALTSIDYEAFHFCSALESIILPKKLSSLSTWSFANCTSLKTVEFEAGNTSIHTIESNAFENCTALTSIELPDSVRWISNAAFQGCTALESVSFSAGCSIYNSAFSGCTSLRDIPAIYSFNSDAFKNCSSLTTVIINYGYMDDAFSGCTSLTDVYFLDEYISLSSNYFSSASRSNLTIHGYTGSTAETFAKTYSYTFEAFDEFVVVDGVLHAYNGAGGDITIPTSVREISKSVFEGNLSITSVVIPGTVHTVGPYAFYNADKMTSIELQYGVQILMQESFSSCNSLVSVSLPRSITRMDDHVFYSAYSLKEIVIPEGVTVLPDSCFSHAEALESVSLPSTLKSIGSYAFNSCYALETLTIPKNVETIASDAFVLSSALKQVNLPDGIISVGSDAFRGCPEDLVITCSAGSATASALGVRSYGYSDPNYPGLKLLSTSAGISASVLDNSLESYILPEGVVSLDSGLFSGCTNLKYVILPASVASISDTAFDALPGAIYAPADSFAAQWAQQKAVFTFDPATSPAVVPLQESVYLSMQDTIPDTGLFRAEAAYLLESTELNYAIEDSSVATLVDGSIVPAGIGDTMIVANLASDASISAGIPIHVRENIESITIGEGLTVASGVSVPLEIIDYTPAGAQGDFVWSIDNPDAATIEGNTLTATAAQDTAATLTVTAWNGVSSSMPLNVYLPEISAVTFDRESISCNPGDELQLNCSVQDQNTTWTNQLVEFSTSDETIAAVDENGVVHVLARGFAQITASSANGLSATIDIDSRIDLSTAEVGVSSTEFTYNGAEQQPAVTVLLDGAMLAEDEAYTLSFTGDTVNAGTVQVKIAGIGAYKGEVVSEYSILPASLENVQASLSEVEFVWDGTAKTPVPELKLGEYVLEQDKDYTLLYANNTNAGTASLTITGMDNFTGSIQMSFTILPRDLSDAVVTLAKTAYDYTDGPIKPGVSSVVLNGETVAYSNYTVSYENNTQVGSARVIVSGKGNYTGSTYALFTIASVHRYPLPDTGEMAEWAPYSSASVHEGENHIYLTEDISSGVSVGSGKTVYLNLNGHTIKSRNSISVSDGGRLILCDEVGTGMIVPQETSYTGAGLLLYEGGRADMYGGTISGFVGTDSYSYRSGVYMQKNSSFNMYGGVIRDCSTPSYAGGGIYSYYGNIHINGGSITGNKANEGGGIYIYRGNLSITGGEISGNTAMSGGGGVYYGNGYASDPYRFEMTGGTISGNTSVYGGGAYVYYSNFDMSGGNIVENNATISGGGLYETNSYVAISDNASILSNSAGASSGSYNTSNGGGVCSSKSLTINGGNISDNQVYGNGGGVSASGAFIMNGGSISGNRALSCQLNVQNGGGLHLPGSSSASLNGGSIESNTASSGYGGGVYAADTRTLYIGGNLFITGNAARSGNTAIHPCIPLVNAPLKGMIDVGKFSESALLTAKPAEGYVLTDQDAAAFVASDGSRGFVRSWDGYAYAGIEPEYTLSLTGAHTLEDLPTFRGVAGTSVIAKAIVDDNQVLLGWTTSDSERPIAGKDYEVSILIPDSDISVCALVMDIPEIEDQTYTGAELQPEFDLVLNGTVLTKDTDYSLTWENNLNAGTAQVTATSLVEPGWTESFSFEILPMPVKLTGAADSVTYDGSEKSLNGLSVEGLPEGASLQGLSWSASGTDVGSYAGSFSGEAIVLDANGADITANCSLELVNGLLTILPADMSSAEIWLMQDWFTYDGTAQEPEALVLLGDLELAVGKDVQLSYSNNVNAGTATITASGAGNYSGQASLEFTIDPASISGAAVSTAQVYYNGTAQEPALKVSLNESELEAGRDYTAVYANNINAGGASVTITGCGNYTGKKTSAFTILPAGIEDAVVNVPDCTYTGEALSPAVDVEYGGKTLVSGTDYSLSYQNNVNAGTASVLLNGLGNYSGTKEVSFSILPADLSAAEVKVSPAEIIYDGTAKVPEVSVAWNGTILSEGSDYSLSFADNIFPGTAKIAISGIGNYTGSTEASFTILGQNLADAELTLAQTEFVYSGSAYEPEPTVVLNGVTLTLNSDYTVSYADNINAGTASIIVSGIGNYAGSATAEFTISPADLSTATVVLRTSRYTYSGQPNEPGLLVRLNGVSLEADTDYIVNYADNINAGTASVIVSGSGNYSGEVRKTFTILAKDLSAAELTAQSCHYDGTPKTPEMTVVLDGVALIAGTDYSVECSNNTEVGTGTATVLGMGNYSGSASTQFTIFKFWKMVLPAALTEIRDEAFCGSAAEAFVLPEGCKRIGSRAFADCKALCAVYFASADMEIADDAFAGSNQVVLYGPAGGTVEAWAEEHGISFLAE